MVAGQLLHAEPVGEGWVVDALREAASVADGRGDPGVAASFLRRALAERPDRGEIPRELAGAELRGGQPEPAVVHLEDALRLTTDDATRIASLRLLASALMVLGRFEDARARMLEAVGLLDAGDDLVLELEAELLGMTSIEPSAFGRREDLDRPGFLRPGGHGASARGSRPAQRARSLRCGLRRRSSRSGAVRWTVGSSKTTAPDSVVGTTSCSRSSSAEQGTSSPIGWTTPWRRPRAAGPSSGRSGRTRSAACCTCARARCARRWPTAASRRGRGWRRGMLLAALALGALVEALAAHGELGEAEEELGRFGLLGAIPDTFYGNWALHGRGWLRLAQGRPAHARDDFEELGRRRSATPAMSAHRRGLALALVRLGDTAGARAAAAGELELARRVGTSAGIGASMRALGLATGGGVGFALLREADATLERSDARLEHARALVDLGAAMRRADRRAASREPLRAGMELAHRARPGRWPRALATSSWPPARARVAWSGPASTRSRRASCGSRAWRRRV